MTALDPAPTRATGGTCPTCRYCADREIPHLCITREAGALHEFLAIAPAANARRLRAELERHPARPLRHGPGGPGGVDRSWCFCQCALPARAAP